MSASSGNPRVRSGSGGGKAGVFGFFLLANIVPLCGIAFAVYKYFRGELDLSKLPRGFGSHATAVGIGIALLFVFARWSLPAVHAVVKFAERGLALRRQVMDGAARGNPFRAALGLPLYGALWALAYPIRFVLMALSLVLVALVLVGLARFLNPDFLTDWIPPLTELSGK